MFLNFQQSALCANDLFSSEWPGFRHDQNRATDALNSQGEEGGEARLLSSCNSLSKGVDGEAICVLLSKRVVEWARGVEQFDISSKNNVPLLAGSNRLMLHAWSQIILDVECADELRLFDDGQA
jgi:hypothetical protein